MLYAQSCLRWAPIVGGEGSTWLSALKNSKNTSHTSRKRAGGPIRPIGTATKNV